MGHTRLGRIPKSRKWKSVVELVLESMGAGNLASDVIGIADQTLDAAEGGLARAANDAGLTYAVFLLTQLSLVGRGDLSVLDSLGFESSKEDSVYDLLDQIQLKLENHVSAHGGSTDYSEMAQQAMGSALLQALESRATSLFGSGPDELESALRQIGTSAGFSRLTQNFYGDYLSRFLNFYLSRITAKTSGYLDFRQVNVFNEELHTYSIQTARIISDFAGGWLSKAIYEKSLSEDAVRKFVYVANKKLAKELVTAKRKNDGAT